MGLKPIQHVAGLTGVAIIRDGTGFLLRIETTRAETFELMASHDQLDVLADLLDDALLTPATEDERAEGG